MAVVTRIAISSGARLRNLLKYLINGDHPNHKVHRIYPVRNHGTVTIENIASRAEEALREINGKPGKKGSKLKTLAHYIIARFIAKSELDAEENAFYDKHMAEGLVDGGGVVSVQHENLVLQASDFNYLLTGWLENPLRVRRTNQDDLLKKARDLSNRLVREMNIKRLAKDRPPIVLAGDRKKEIARQKRGALIEEELAEIAKFKPVNLETLPGILKDLGHTVVEPKRKKDHKSSISRDLKEALRLARMVKNDCITVVPRDRKKAIRLSRIALIQACYAIKKRVVVKIQEDREKHLEEQNKSPQVNPMSRAPVHQHLPKKSGQQPPMQDRGRRR